MGLVAKKIELSSNKLESFFQFPKSYWDSINSELFPKELQNILKILHKDFEPQRKVLLSARLEKQKQYDQGQVPAYLSKNSIALTGDWKVAPLPDILKKRRVEITGPAHSTKMVIQMLSPNDEGAIADTAMIDFEDSLKPDFENVLNGYKNVIGAVNKNLYYENVISDKQIKVYKLNPNKMAFPMVRVRGLHLDESNILIDDVPIAAGLLDLAVCFFHTAKNYINQGLPPKYYVPKCEDFLEARWWNDLFIALQEKCSIPRGTLRATFLIETLPAAFQIEEILYEIREHAAALNVGRWDKIFSDIKICKNHQDCIFPDRSSITMKSTWMENYAKRIIKICHKRGALAIGGMAAFTPGSTAEIRKEQTSKVVVDKNREFELGHDGCWVSHPYFIGCAITCFKKNNQLDVMLENFPINPDLLPSLTNGLKGPKTLNGLRTNIRVGIAYVNGLLNGQGCISLDYLMEDLATLEISRSQVWQWLKQGVELDSGEVVDKVLVTKLFDEEYKKLNEEFSIIEKAKIDALAFYLEKDFRAFLTTKSATKSETKSEKILE